MTFPVTARSLATGYFLQALRASMQGTLSGFSKRAARIPYPEWGCRRIAGRISGDTDIWGHSTLDTPGRSGELR